MSAWVTTWFAYLATDTVTTRVEELAASIVAAWATAGLACLATDTVTTRVEESTASLVADWTTAGLSCLDAATIIMYGLAPLSRKENMCHAAFTRRLQVPVENGRNICN